MFLDVIRLNVYTFSMDVGSLHARLRLSRYTTATVLLTVASTDVIHSWALPALGMKVSTVVETLLVETPLAGVLTWRPLRRRGGL